LLLLAALPACSGEYDNPFEPSGRPASLPPGADIVFAGNTQETQPGALHELFAVADDGSSLTRLTSCTPLCDTLEAAPATDRERMMMRRVVDANNDDTVGADDGAALFYADLERRVESGVLSDARASGVDWAATGDVIVYSGAGEGAVDDLWVMDPNGQNRRNLTLSPAVRERRPRIDPTGQVAVFERIDATGKGQVFIFQTTLSQIRLTAGGPGSAPLPGTPYLVGSDADPDYSPDGRSVAFRRLAELGDGRLGYWDLMTVRIDGTGLTLIASGPQFRGAPDWGPQGIVFNEVDLAAGASRLVVVQPDGSGRSVPVTVGSAFDLLFPRWLTPP
jgi:Tol biopolymer transport system component